MNIIDIINKKRLGLELNEEEINYVILNFLNDNIKDYQMSSLLMAICINDMSDEETIKLTECMINTSNKIEYNIEGIKVDKHSTGGIGDTTTLIVGPIVASCGVIFPKMSGRGLGYTGGTIDKLESIENFNVNLSMDEFIDNLKKINISIISQTEDLVKIDKKIYALRNVTGTTNSIPLIASSIMSKKIITNADKIFIDVKYGKGALVNDKDSAARLANLMKKIGDKFNKETICLITNMNYPLGNTVGNSLEVIEAIKILKNELNNDLSYLSIIISSYIVSMAKNIEFNSAKEMVMNNLQSLKAFDKFKKFVILQKGNIDKIKVSKNILEIKSKQSGYLNDIDALKIGMLSLKLGANKKNLDSIINHEVGIEMLKNIGDYINESEKICNIYYDDVLVDEFEVLDAFVIDEIKGLKEDLILGVIK